MAENRISLKSIADFKSNFKFVDIADLSTIKNKIVPTAQSTRLQGLADESYVKLFALGPVVQDLLDAQKATEDELVHLREFVAGQLGTSADDAQLPPDLYTVKRDGTIVKIMADGVWVGPSSGLVGAQGVQGSQGAQGAQGFIGTTGVRGVQGAGGIPGDPGVQGSIGDNGAGAQGIQGNIGPQGAPGANPAGPQGYQGFQGDDGSFSPPELMRGDRGAQGSQGSQGSSIRGAQGSQGAPGVQGNPGVVGSQGDQGSAGFTGDPETAITANVEAENVFQESQPNVQRGSVSHDHRITKPFSYGSNFSYSFPAANIPLDDMESYIDVDTTSLDVLNQVVTPFIMVHYIIKF